MTTFMTISLVECKDVIIDHKHNKVNKEGEERERKKENGG